MDVEKSSVCALLNGEKQFLIPVYQRIYSWGYEQCNRLWNDIINMLDENNDSHFLGSVVCITEKATLTGVQKHMVIDGQQRLTTFTLFLIALRDITPEKSEMINSSFIINPYESDELKYKLILTEEDKDVLLSLIDKKPIPEGTKSRILEMYYYFKKQISKSGVENSDLLKAARKLQIVIIILNKGSDDPQAIFESLNSTGKKLSQSDLIRNYILMGLDKNEQNDLYNMVWRPFEKLFGNENQEENMDFFFRDYLTMKLHRIPKIEEVYDEFKKWRASLKTVDIKTICDDLYDYAKIYTDIIFITSSNGRLNNLYKELRDLNMGIVKPFLMAVIKDYEDSVLASDSDLYEIIELCISYVLRRSICGIPTNSLNKTFATLENKINKKDYLNSLKAFFINSADYKGFPNDVSFGESFVSKDIYNSRNRNYILSKLENYENKSPVIIEKLTIEHVMPRNKNLSDEWKKDLGPDWERVHEMYLHTIGNLTLTGYNSEMSDKPFAKKLEMNGGFKQTAVRLNQYIIRQDTWNEETIKERANILLKQAIKMWEFPTLTEEEMAPYIEKEEQEPLYSIDSYNTNELTLSLFEEINKRIMNLSSEVRREFKKMYVAYKLDTNFVDIIFQGKRLRISVNLDFEEVYDPKGICRDITSIGRWGNGNCEVFLEDIDQLDYIMEIIKQSHDSQI